MRGRLAAAPAVSSARARHAIRSFWGASVTAPASAADAARGTPLSRAKATTVPRRDSSRSCPPCSSVCTLRASWGAASGVRASRRVPEGVETHRRLVVVATPLVDRPRSSCRRRRPSGRAPLAASLLSAAKPREEKATPRRRSPCRLIKERSTHSIAVAAWQSPVPTSSRRPRVAAAEHDGRLSDGSSAADAAGSRLDPRFDWPPARATLARRSRRAHPPSPPLLQGSGAVQGGGCRSHVPLRAAAGAGPHSACGDGVGVGSE